MHRFGYTLETFNINNIQHDVDSVLFKRVENVDHCIHNLLPPERTVPTALRTRCYHSCITVTIAIACTETPIYYSYIVRAVYSNSY